MMFKSKVAYLLIPLLIAFGFWLRQISKEKTVEIETLPKDEVTEAKIDQTIPECAFGLCPKYESHDTDGDGLSESVVWVPVAMTKGAGEVLIIDEGRIVFRSGGAAEISYQVPEDGSGIILKYAKEFDDTGLDVKTWTTSEYKYSQGNYILSKEYDTTK